MRAEIIFTQITLFASISFTSFYHVITLTMRTEHWNEHHRSFLCFSLLSLFAKIQYNINQLKYPDVKHDPCRVMRVHFGVTMAEMHHEHSDTPGSIFLYTAAPR